MDQTRHGTLVAVHIDWSAQFSGLIFPFLMAVSCIKNDRTSVITLVCVHDCRHESDHLEAYQMERTIGGAGAIFR